MSVGNVARVTAVLAALIAAAGSASSTSSGSQNQPAGPNGQAYGQGGPNGQAGYGQASAAPNGQALGAPSGPDSQNGPPPAQQMEPQRALGLWRSTFGAVKIEPDGSHGGLQSGSVQGIWMYQRQGQDVVGYFSGNLRGNVLQFRWQEPNDPPLTGEGFLVFDTQGRQYSGRWWSDRRDRVGDWNGWRQPGAARAAQSSNTDTGEADLYVQPKPQRAPSRRAQPYQPQPYQPQSSPYQQPSPYQQQSSPPAQPQPAPQTYN